jgi:sugar/nucleoside kinase (ribokinase family)
MRVWSKAKWIFGWPSRIIRLIVRRIDVLVVGSAHIETTGELADNTLLAQGSDHEGRIVYSVGGSGYNVAVNLAAAGKNGRVALDTLLPKESRLAELVLSKLMSNGVSTDYVRRLSIEKQGSREFLQAAMGGRVELRAKQTRLYSVSRTLVNTPEYWTRNRDRIAVNRAKALVVDTYLFEAAAQEVVRLAVSNRTPLFVLAATDSTARRFARSVADGFGQASGGVLCIVGVADVIDAMTFEIDPDEARHGERLRMLRSRSGDVEAATAQATCRLLRTRYLAFAHDRVATIVAWTGDHFQIDMRDMPVTNQKGAGDALMAAVVDVFLSSGGKTAGVVGAQDVLDLKNSELTGALRTEIRHHTQRAFRSEGATPRSVISFEEPFESWRQALGRQTKYLSMQAVNAAGWLAILIVINRLAILAGLDDVVRLPIKKVSAFLGAALQWLKTVLALMFGH